MDERAVRRKSPFPEIAPITFSSRSVGRRSAPGQAGGKWTGREGSEGN